MKTYISFLRGINVSGKNRISMPDLKRLCESLGLRNVSTYIQSGNVVFESLEENPTIIGKKIETGIMNTLGMDVRIMIRDQQEYKKVLEKNPFINDRDAESEKLYVTFLSDLPENIAIKKITTAVPRGGCFAMDGGGSSLLIDSDSRVVNIEDGGGSKYGKVLLKTGPNQGDEFIIYGKEIYLYCQNGYGRTKFSNSFFRE